MTQRDFAELVVLAKENTDAMVAVLEKLKPLIKAYTKKLFFLEQDDAQQELSIAIIEAVRKISKCENDGQCLTYINNAVKFKFVYLCKKNLKKEEIEDVNMKDLDDAIYQEKYMDIETIYDLQIKERDMTQTQKDILRYLILGYSDSEIANIIGISRQYINRIKKSFY